MVARTLDIYLEDGLRQSAERGKHNYFGLVRAAFERQGFAVRYRSNGVLDRATAALSDGYNLFHMDDPLGPHTLTTRRAYFYPFWQIETSGKRWDWTVAQARFDAEQIDEKKAQSFFGAWRNRLFGDLPDRAAREGFIYMPLQGRLAEHRTFQSMSPLRMIEVTMAADPTRVLRTTLHPKERYTAAERAALSRLVEANTRLELVDTPMETLLTGADYVVTQNSSAALCASFFRKPAVLFARSDFHHIAENVADVGLDAAFARVLEPGRSYARFVYWFLQQQSINAGRPDAEARILETVRARGWKI